MTESIDPLSVLLDLTSSLAEDRPLESALLAVTDASLRLLPGNHASVRVFDDGRSDLLCGARSGEGSEAKPLSFKRGEGVIGWVAESGKMAVIEDTTTDDRFKAAGRQGFEIRAMIAIPLFSAGQVVGVLSVAARQTGAFTPRHQLLAQLLANCAVPALERARLERLAVTDVQTLAFNHRVLFPRLTEEMERSQRYVLPLSYLLMDLDHFKLVNDTHGHPAGDRVLREFTDRVRALVRRPDVLVRRGGEEFVLIMPHTTAPQARIVAERIRQNLVSLPLHGADDLEIPQTVSIGVATWNGRESPRELDARADAAMYDAKLAGRNQVMVSQQMEDEPPVDVPG